MEYKKRQKDLETKLALVREFQDFAEARGMAFEFGYNTLFGSIECDCYRSYSNKDQPVYILSIASRTSFPDQPALFMAPNQRILREYFKSYKDMKTKDPDLEHYIMTLHSYCAPIRNLLRPAHLRQNPAQLVSMVAHEGLHATVLHYDYRNIHLNLSLEESLAEASAYIFLRDFRKATANSSMGAQSVRKQLTEMRNTHNALSSWLTRFKRFYSAADGLALKELEKKRTGMFTQMENNFRMINTNPIHLEAFDFELNEGFNNAALVFFESYGVYFKPLLGFYEQCDNFKDFLEKVNKLPKNKAKLDSCLGVE